MVFRKPYAFLIKNFKLIHVILSALMIYLSIKCNSIFNIYNSLVKSENVSTVGLVSKNFFAIQQAILMEYLAFLSRPPYNGAKLCEGGALHALGKEVRYGIAVTEHL